MQVPRVFEPAFCEQLLDYYATHDPEETGFMRDVDGKTRALLDHKMKRRSDVQIADETLRAGARQRLIRRLVPEIKKAFQYEATRVERYIVACYESEGGGYFNAHRRFAVTINLNAEDYDGGELRFPEYGQQSYKAPTGGAVVFFMFSAASSLAGKKRYALLLLTLPLRRCSGQNPPDEHGVRGKGPQQTYSG